MRKGLAAYGGLGGFGSATVPEVHHLTSTLTGVRLRWLALVFVVSLALTPQAASLEGGTSLPPGIDAKRIYETCSGQWAGTLEYRDYQSDKHIGLPTNLQSQTDGKSLSLKFTYDDGPGKIVREASMLAVDPERHTVKIQSDENSREQLTVTEAEISGSKIRLLLSGSGEESGKQVEVRSTLVCAPNTLTWLRETRLAGQEFSFRHKYSFTRFPIQAH